ncbi:hypothetical protein [Halostagnicola sp. A-GB9-2]|uniref:hypothetical protein n=1 Tax=Halostagnicola sp. A-GB9-2 TaxID=3048066 RepID=UPI0024C0E148|nr:hypothetical protein [Halostagnicola sp. A-GB9-2]MDJ1433603.1 hypothetical protein [Halostagnicola sp. A-GB9-2]
MPSKATGTRGAVTIFLFLVWAIMILGVEVDHAIVTLQYGAGQYIQHLLTALVFLVIGRMWGIEVETLISGLVRGDGSGNDRDADRGYHSREELEDYRDDD